MVRLLRTEKEQQVLRAGGGARPEGNCRLLGPAPGHPGLSEPFLEGSAPAFPWKAQGQHQPEEELSLPFSAAQCARNKSCVSFLVSLRNLVSSRRHWPEPSLFKTKVPSCSVHLLEQLGTRMICFMHFFGTQGYGDVF